MKSVGVFLGGSGAAKAQYVEAARTTGETLARQGYAVVYGGGRIGLMGVLADAALGAGGRVIGVIPQHLVDQEVAHPGLTELHVVGDMAERKAVMAELSEAFIALPGGFGTLDEIFEMVTWTQIGTQQKPTGLLNIAHYYDDLLKWIDQAVEEGLVRGPHRSLVLDSPEINILLDKLSSWSMPTMPKLI